MNFYLPYTSKVAVLSLVTMLTIEPQALAHNGGDHGAESLPFNPKDLPINPVDRPSPNSQQAYEAYHRDEFRRSWLTI